MRHYFIGVDIAGEANTWVASLAPSEDALQLVFGPRPASPQELLSLIEKEEPSAVAIDGQLSLAFSEANGFRTCDTELRALLPPDCRSWVASANSLMAVPIRARLLADALSPSVATVVETHPRASMFLELGEAHLPELKEYKRSSEAVRHLAAAWCERNHIKGVTNVVSDGGLDSLVCATVAYCCHIAPHRLRFLRHSAADRQGRGPFLVMDSDLARSKPRDSVEQSTTVEVVEAASPTSVAAPSSGSSSMEPTRSLTCPACGSKEFKRWPWGWDAHAAYSCAGLSATEPEARKLEFRRRFAEYF